VCYDVSLARTRVTSKTRLRAALVRRGTCVCVCVCERKGGGGCVCVRVCV